MSASFSRDPYFFVHMASAQTRTNKKRIANIIFNARGRRFPSTPTSFESLFVIRVGRKKKKTHEATTSYSDNNPLNTARTSVTVMTNDRMKNRYH